MKKATLALSVLVLSVCCARAQGLQNVWQVVNPSVQNGPLVFTTDDSGFIATSANLYVTTDGGQNFTAMPLPAQVFNMDIKDMCWPTSQDGYLLFLSSDGTSSVLTHTTNAGNTWSVSNLPSNNVFYSISFPSPDTGYGSGPNNPVGSGYFIAKTTNDGNSWNVTKTSTLPVGPVCFPSTDAGMVVIFNSASVPQISYTLDGLSSIRSSDSAIPFSIDGQQTTFLHWNSNGSWMVQYQGLVRSSDSGKDWSTVLADDQTGNYGTISCACFHQYRGFAFGDNSKVFQSLDYGATWHAFTNTLTYTTFPDASVTPSLTCSMPTDTVAYMLGQSGNTIALLRVAVAPAAVAPAPVLPSEALAVAERGPVLEFTSAPEAGERSIVIYDVLGRKCAGLTLQPMSIKAVLPASMLEPGSYFARLGNSVAKFIVW